MATDVSNHDTTLSPFSPLLEQAIELSAQWHDQTYRKSRWRDEAFVVPPDHDLRVPVVAHLTAVALTLQRAGWGDATVAAAFLHDVIEDRNQWRDHFKPDDLRSIMGDHVVDLVQYVSEDKYDVEGRPRPWRDRKEDYVERLHEAPDDAVAISVADKLHNLWTINESLENGVDMFSDHPDRPSLRGSPQEQHWFFREILSISAARQDDRFRGLRRQLRMEIDRFQRLTTRA